MLQKINSKYFLYRNLSIGTMTGKILENVMFMMYKNMYKKKILKRDQN